MKSILIAFALGLVTISTTYAQTETQNNTTQTQEARPRATPEERASRQTKMMANTLGLSADQEAKVKALNLKRLNEIDALRESKEADGVVDRNRAKTIRDNWNIELKSILTPEQYTKYEAQQGEMRGKRSRGNKSSKRS